MYTVKEIVEVTKGKLISGNPNMIIENFSKDTRTITSKDMYVAIKGENFDGNKFNKDALDKGAVGCIVNENVEGYPDKVIIKVEDSVLALINLAKYKRDKYNIPIIAVTGSVGKTSTKDIIASVLSKKFKVLKTEGNLNTAIGLSLTILGLEDHEAIVLEMGMDDFGQISILTNIAKPTIAVITNIGTSHIGRLRSRENILKAKLEILEGLNEDGIVVINNDNDLLHNWKNSNYNVKTYGIARESDFFAYNINLNESGSEYLINIDDKTYKVEVPIGGKHFIYNSLAGISVGKSLGIQMKEILNSIKKFELTKMRMDIKTKGGITIINDAYNASYESMEPVLEYLKALKSNRKIAVLGDIKELGEFSEEMHKRVGELVTDIDMLITVGRDSRYIAEKAKAREIYSYDEKEQAVEFLSSILKPNDAILIKASNSMKLYEIEEEIWKRRK